MISDQETIRKALLNNATVFAGRPDFYSYKVVNSFGLEDFSPTYCVYKKHTLKAFGQFAKVRRKELQQVAHNAVQMLVKEFKIANNQPIDPNPIICKAACAIMGYICFGKFLSSNDEVIDKMLQDSENFPFYIAFGVVCDFLPWAKVLVRRQLQALEEMLHTFRSHFDKLAAGHTEEYNGRTIRDMTDMFRKVAEEMDEDEKKMLKVDEHMLKCHISTMFGGGFHTIGCSLNYAVMIMALYPEIQTRVQVEIDSVIGRDRFPEFDDEGVLPYTAATITEIYHYHSMTALGITHSTTCDTEFGGYFIPKKTPVIFNLQSANYDEKVFNNPEK